jgi:hypothetical protein
LDGRKRCEAPTSNEEVRLNWTTFPLVESLQSKVFGLAGSIATTSRRFGIQQSFSKTKIVRRKIGNERIEMAQFVSRFGAGMYRDHRWKEMRPRPRA